MKHVTIEIRFRPINEIIGREFSLELQENATVIDVINEVDNTLLKKGVFPYESGKEKFASLLHMTYNPTKERFYEQTGLLASTPTVNFLNVRNDPKMKLPDNTEIVLLPYDGCSSSSEKVISYEEFREFIAK